MIPMKRRRRSPAALRAGMPPGLQKEEREGKKSDLFPC